MCGAKFTPVVPTQRGAQGPVKKVAKQHFGAQKKGSGCRGVGDPGCESESRHVFPQHRTIALFSLCTVCFSTRASIQLLRKKTTIICNQRQVECKLPNQPRRIGQTWIEKKRHNFIRAATVTQPARSGRPSFEASSSFVTFLLF